MGVDGRGWACLGVDGCGWAWMGELPGFPETLLVERIDSFLPGWMRCDFQTSVIDGDDVNSLAGCSEEAELLRILCFIWKSRGRRFCLARFDEKL